MSVIAEENVDEYNQPTEIESLCMNCYQNEMNREVVKVDSATTRILELDFEIPAYTQKGYCFQKSLHLWRQLHFRSNRETEAFWPEDGQDRTNKVKSGGATEELGTKITFHLTDMSRDLLKIMAGDMDVLDYPAGNRYLQNVYAPDPEMTTEKYTRTFEKNEDLGLNDMKTEGYQE